MENGSSRGFKETRLRGPGSRYNPFSMEAQSMPREYWQMAQEVKTGYVVENKVTPTLIIYTMGAMECFWAGEGHHWICACR